MLTCKPNMLLIYLNNCSQLDVIMETMFQLCTLRLSSGEDLVLADGDKIIKWRMN